MAGETLYRCPRCYSGPRPRDEWASRYGVMTCGSCLSQGWVIMPVERDGKGFCPACQMNCFTLYGRSCCCDRVAESERASDR